MQSHAPPISSLVMLKNIEKIAREVRFFSILLEFSDQVLGFQKV
jgi:hypothetical protein